MTASTVEPDTTTNATLSAQAESAARRSRESFRLWSQLTPFVNWFRRSIIIAGVLMVGFVVLESLRMYQTLAGVHPWLGGAALVGVGVGMALVLAPAWRFLRMPRVVEPPPLPADGKLTPAQCLAEVRYLDRYLANCSRNPSFGSKRVAITAARTELIPIITQARMANSGNVSAVTDRLLSWSHRSMVPVLADVDARADRLIYQEALAVGLATAASPNGVLDAFVMLWRSVRLVSEIGVLYYGRPGIWGMLAICRDVSLAVAIAGYMQNVTQSLGNVLASTLGKAGGLVAGPAVDGITNALVLIRIGYLAKERCRSYRRWDAATRRSAVVNALSATQMVAFGLSAEILRQVGSGVSAIASGLASRMSDVGESAMDAAETVASTATRVANDVADVATRAAEAAYSGAQSVRGFFGRVFNRRTPSSSQEDPHDV